MLDIFTGYDPREAVGWHVFTQSVMDHASQPVCFHPLQRKHNHAPEGTNEFTFSRFLIPYMLGWRGVAVFVDGCDMLCRGDIHELEALRNPHMAVQVVKHEYRTRHPRKYVGTSMEADNADYEKKNWSSVMLINAYNMAWRKVTPETVNKMSPLDLLQMKFIPDDRIGELPAEWNCLVDEHDENPDAKLLHWTAGIPAMPHYSEAPHAAEWFEGQRAVNHVG